MTLAPLLTSLALRCRLLPCPALPCPTPLVAAMFDFRARPLAHSRRTSATLTSSEHRSVPSMRWGSAGGNRKHSSNFGSAVPAPWRLGRLADPFLGWAVSLKGQKHRHMHATSAARGPQPSHRPASLPSVIHPLCSAGMAASAPLHTASRSCGSSLHAHPAAGEGWPAQPRALQPDPCGPIGDRRLKKRLTAHSPFHASLPPSTPWNPPMQRVPPH